MNRITDTFILSNGYRIPCLGFGTWQTPDGETAIHAVKSAIEAGYHHIDAAAVYENERSVGQGIKESNIDRKDLFVTSKVWNTERGYKKTLAAFEKTLSDLQLEYRLQKKDDYHSAYRDADNHRRQKQNDSKRPNKDQSELSQPAACTAV